MSKSTNNRKKLEREIEKEFVRDLNERLPGGRWIKGNSQMQQGIPDRMFLHGPHWAMIEFKREEDSDRQENQAWFIEKFNGMSYAAIVSPENRDEVLDEIQRHFLRSNCSPQES